MKFSFIVILVLISIVQAFSQYEVIVKVYDNKNNPVNARVVIEENFLSTETIDGTAYFKNVPKGKKTISVIADGFELSSLRNYNVTADISDNTFEIPLNQLKNNDLVITGYISLPDTMQLRNARIVFFDLKSETTTSEIPNSFGYYRLEIPKEKLGDKASLSLMFNNKLLKKAEVIIPFNNNLVIQDFNLLPEEEKLIQVKFYYDYREDFQMKKAPIVITNYDQENIDGGFIIMVPENAVSDSLVFSVKGTGIKEETYKYSLKNYSEYADPFRVKIKREIKTTFPWAQISPAFYKFSYITNLSNNDANDIVGRVQHCIGFYYHPHTRKNKLALGLSYTFKTRLNNTNSFKTLGGNTGTIETNITITNYPALHLKGFTKPYNFNGISFFYELICSVSNFNSGENEITDDNNNIKSYAAYSEYVFIPVVNIGLKYNIKYYLSFELSAGFSTYELTTREYNFDYWGYGYTNYDQKKVRFYDIPVNFSIIGFIPKLKH